MSDKAKKRFFGLLSWRHQHIQKL